MFLYDPASVSSLTHLMLKEEAWPAAAAGKLASWPRLSSGLELEVLPYLAGSLAFITWHQHPQGEIPSLGGGEPQASGRAVTSCFS